MTAIHHKQPDEVALAANKWLLHEQQHLAEIVGEPILITIRLIYDGSMEIEVETFTGRHGMATGDSLPETLREAVMVLLQLDTITGLAPLANTR